MNMTDRRSVSESDSGSTAPRSEETLALRQTFRLDTAKWTDFLDALETPPRELPGVQALFAKRSPFEDRD